MPDGSIVLMGGTDGTGLKNDVWRFMPAGSSEQNPSHTYTTPGTYSVALQAYNAGGYNSTRKTGYITVSSSGWDGDYMYRDYRYREPIRCWGTSREQRELPVSISSHPMSWLRVMATRSTGRSAISGMGASASPAGISNVTVRNLTISNWGKGIDYENVTGGAIDNITVLFSQTQGITLGTSSSVTLKNVNASLNWVGIAVIEGSDDNTLTHVTASRNDAVGLWLYAARNNESHVRYV